MGACEVGPWVGEQKLLGETPLGGSPNPDKTYLPTYLKKNHQNIISSRQSVKTC